MIDFKKSVIFLNGFPGTGKLTIAKEIAKHPNFFLFDNHTVNNVLFSLFTPEQRNQLRNDQLWDQRRKIYDIVFDVFLNSVPDKNNYVFTGACMQEKLEAVEFYNHFKKFHSEIRGATFLPVQLICNQEELKKRVVSPERLTNHKLADVNILENILSEHSLVHLNHPNTMELDITSTPPQTSARLILEHLATLK